MKIAQLLALVALVLISNLAKASQDDPCDPPTHTYCPGYADYHRIQQIKAYTISADADTLTVFDNLGIQITVPAAGRDPNGNAIPTGDWIADFGVAGIFDGFTNSLFGGGRDMGDFICTSCPVTGGQESAAQWGPFIYSVANPILFPSLGPSGMNGGQWRPGDTIAICDGTSCIILQFYPNAGTNAWWPSIDPKKPHFKADKHKYKNKVDNQGGAPVVLGGDSVPGQIFVGNRTPISNNVPIIYLNGMMPKGTVTSPPPEQWIEVPTLGGGGRNPAYDIEMQ